MGRLIYSAITSLDGYTEDASGDFQWSAPDDEVHRFVNDLTRPVGTHLLGRKTHDVMAYWETDDPDWGATEADFASIWRGAEKIVYSRSARRFDPEEVRELKATRERDLAIGGAELAAQAITAGLVDEYQQFLNPIVVGGGKHFLPQEVRFELELLEQRRFANGVVFLRYAAV
ncbi:MAG TPA: dihydrofolate reductase family protein [Thermoleophilaceae bacterium]|nr:dihydrofolate reductase family protein [Thermoleophilaceae bacterium]